MYPCSSDFPGTEELEQQDLCNDGTVVSNKYHKYGLLAPESLLGIGFKLSQLTLNHKIDNNFKFEFNPGLITFREYAEYVRYSILLGFPHQNGDFYKALLIFLS